MTGRPKRAALYLRVSTAGQTVDNQRLGLKVVCEQRGWTVVQNSPGQRNIGRQRPSPATGLGYITEGCLTWQV